jgi:5-methylcytosine-specific restriction endonuclease McrA
MNPLGHRKWRELRAAILQASTTCWICGNPGADTIDHIIPRSQGGAIWDPANLRPAHGKKIPGVCPGNYGRTPRRPPKGLNTSRAW